MTIDRQDTHTGAFLLLQIKSNLGPLASPLSYEIDDAGTFFWTALAS